MMSKIFSPEKTREPMFDVKPDAVCRNVQYFFKLQHRTIFINDDLNFVHLSLKKKYRLHFVLFEPYIHKKNPSISCFLFHKEKKNYNIL